MAARLAAKTIAVLHPDAATATILRGYSTR